MKQTPFMKNILTQFIAIFAIFSAHAQNPIQIHHDLWTEDGWWYMGREEFTYSPENLVELHTLYSEDAQTGEWEKIFEEKYTYDSTGLLIRKSSRIKIEGEDTWLDYQRWTYEYDLNNRLAVQTLEEFTVNLNDEWVWQPFDRYLYDYNSLHQKISQLYQTWSPFSDWTNDHIVLYTYEDSQLSSELVKLYSDDTITFDRYRTNYFYSDSEQLTSFEKYEYISDSWIPSEKEENLYDVQDKLIQTTRYSWKQELQDYKLSSRDSLLYNLDNLLEEKVTQIFPNESWDNYRRYRYTYPTPTYIPSSTAQYRLYPNPASQLINIQFNNSGDRTIDILDLQGRIVHSYRTQDIQVQLPIAYLPAQVYIIRTQQNSNVQTLKFIKQ